MVKNKQKLMWGLFVFVLSIILVITVFKLVFDIAPTSATVESFLKDNSCFPYATETNSDNEYPCAYYLRRHTATIFGQIINAGSPLFATNPFGYFNYETATDDFHTYVFVVTRDKGPLVYNPVNGKYIGSYNTLMSRMGCEFKVNEHSVFSSQRNKLNLGVKASLCLSDIQIQKLNLLSH